MDIPQLGACLGGSEPAFRARQLYEALYRRRIESLDQLTTFPKPLRQRLAAEFEIGYPGQAALYTASDWTKRYLLTLSGGTAIETVFMPEERRDTLCISTQAGCPVDCKFCLTALMGLERNLTAGEIAGQVLHAARDNNLWSSRRRINIVMMGQGEPLLNLNNVLQAARIFTDPKGLGISPRRVTVSTAGIVSRLAEFGQAPAATRPRLAISLNASSEEQRRELMPITRKNSLADLLDACRGYPLREWERLSFEYVLLAGVNDSDADARRVLRMLAGLKCKVNLIPLNPGPGIPYGTPGPERVASFQSIIRRGLPCFVRRPRGLEIYAACGQLKRMEALSQPPLTRIG
jgi:23S rRNA (adenine2503-C2)-methyltransferase